MIFVSQLLRYIKQYFLGSLQTKICKYQTCRFIVNFCSVEYWLKEFYHKDKGNVYKSLGDIVKDLSTLQNYLDKLNGK